MLGFVALVVTPVGLEEDGVDLREINGFGAVPDGFDHGANAEVFDGSEGAFGAACDEVGGGFGEGCVGEADAFELGVDVLGKICGGELFEFGGVGDAGFEVLVGAELEGGVKEGLADEDEVVVFWEVFEEEAEFAECFDGDEVGVIDDGNEDFPFGVEVEERLLFHVLASGFQQVIRMEGWEAIPLRRSDCS